MENMTNVFDALRKKAESQAGVGGTGVFGNQNILKLKQGSSYKLRLLWINPPNGINREYPMINQYVHHYWDDNAIGSKNIDVYCKTSQYDEGETRAGWECPICKEMSKCYKEYSNNGSQSFKEIYDIFRRTFRGYVPVYVISGPEEDLHKIKILQYSKTFKDFFDLNIFGIAKNQRNEDGSASQITIDESDILGINAFTYYEPGEDEVKISAYDLIIMVGTKTIPIKGKMTKVPDYTIKFSNKMSEIDFDGEPITTERYLGLSEELNFDKDFFKKSTIEELNAFLNKYISRDAIEEDVIEDGIVEESQTKSKTLNKFNEISKNSVNVSKPKKAVIEDEVEDDIDIEEEEIVEERPVTKAKVNKAPSVIMEEDEDDSPSKSDDDDDEIDIDDLLKDIV